MAVSVRNGALEFDALINNTAFKQQIDEIERRLVSMTATAEKEAKAIDNLVKNTATAIASYATFASATDFVSQVVKVRGEFQQLEIAFTTMLKSKEDADRLLKQAVDLAAKTPFTLQDVGGAAKQLLAYGFAARDVTRNIEMLGNVAAGVGAPLNDIVYLYGTLKTQGQVFTRDLLQFTARGIPIVAALADQFGVAESEIKGMVESGKVGFPDIERAFKSLTGEAGLFYNLMQEQSKSLTGQVSNLQDAWSRMLNEIGKSNQGLLSDALSSAIDLVENYQTVIDVLKGIIIAYGSYRAALIAIAATQGIVTAATAGVTLAETLHYAALVAVDKATKILKATMLTTPYGAVAAAIGVLVGALVLLNRETEKARDIGQEVADAQNKITAEFEKQKDQIDGYANQLKKANLTEQERIAIYEKLKGISPEIVKGLSAQSLTYDSLMPKIREYIGLKQAEINVDVQALDAEKRKQRRDEIEEEIKLLQKRAETVKNGGTNSRIIGGSSFGANTGASNVGGSKDTERKINERIEQLKAERTKLEESTVKQINAPAVAPKEQEQTIKFLEDQIKLKKEERDQVSATSQKYKEYTKQIEDLEKKVRAITGEKVKTTPADKAADKVRDKLKELMNEIAQAERETFTAGLTSQQAEIARIEAKYDDLRNKAKELKADAGVFARIDRAEAEAIGVERMNERVDKYQSYISEQEQIFKDFEQMKVDFGTDKAKELSNNQASEFTNYVEFLRSQLALLQLDNSTAGVKKRQAVATALTAAEKDQMNRDRDFQLNNLKRVLEATKTFNIQRKQIEDNYQRDVTTLKQNYTGADLQERLAALKAARDQELADLNSTAARSSDVYQKLNQDILLFTRQQLIARKKELEKYLATTIGIPPLVRKDIEDYVRQLDGILQDTATGFIDPRKAAQVSEDLAQISGSFGQMADALRDSNAGLADTLSTMSDITGVASNVAGAFASFASGNVIDGITKSISAIVGVFKIFAQARKSQREAQKEMEAFQLRMLSSEVDINLLYRQRMLDQVKINQLRLQGVKEESKLLKQQSEQNKTEFARIFALIQKEQFISGKREEKYGGFLGVGRKTRLVNTYSTLAGKTYDDLEKLFLSGQLEGRALELFKTLEKLKNEGVDIDAALAANSAAAKEIFTGTTAESIADSITEGFANGLRSAQDFSDNFEQLMKGAILNALKYQTLEGPLKEFYDAFAANAESDGILTEAEIKQLRDNFNGIISNAGARFDELKKITNIDFNNANAVTQQKGLAGAIKGITAEQADLLAGQFGGLRLTAVDHLRVSQSGLTELQKITSNTSHLVIVRAVLERLELNGIKVK